MIKYISTHTGKEIDDAIDGVATNAANIATNTADISTLKTDVNTNTTDISTLKTDVETNTSDISTLKTDVETNTSDISTLKTDVETNTSDISTLKTDVETNTSDISSLEAKVDTNAKNISDNTTMISALTSSNSQNQTDIATLKTDVATNTTNITTNTTDIATNKNNIETNTTAITGMKEKTDQIDTLTLANGTTIWRFNGSADMDTDGNEIINYYAPKSSLKFTTVSAGNSGVTVTPTTTGNTTDYSVNIKADTNYLTIDSTNGLTLAESVITALNSSAGATVSVSSSSPALNVTPTTTGTNTDYSIGLKTDSTYFKIDSDTDNLTLADDTVTKINNASAAISVYSNTDTNYQLKITNGDGTEIITPNLMGKSAGTTTIKTTLYDSSNYSTYADTVYVYNANRAAQSLTTPESLAATVTSGEKVITDDFLIDINQTDFGWDNAAYIISTTPVTVSSAEMFIETVNVNATANNTVYLIPTSLITVTASSDIATAISTLLTADTIDSQIIQIANNLVYTGGNAMTIALKLTSVTDGSYYVTLSARSDNSKPIFTAFWIQE